jgi:hypothetical protein
VLLVVLTGAVHLLAPALLVLAGLAAAVLLALALALLGPGTVLGLAILVGAAGLAAAVVAAGGGGIGPG